MVRLFIGLIWLLRVCEFIPRGLYARFFLDFGDWVLVVIRFKIGLKCSPFLFSWWISRICFIYKSYDSWASYGLIRAIWTLIAWYSCSDRGCGSIQRLSTIRSFYSWQQLVLRLSWQDCWVLFLHFCHRSIAARWLKPFMYSIEDTSDYIRGISLFLGCWLSKTWINR